MQYTDRMDVCSGPYTMMNPWQWQQKGPNEMLAVVNKVEVQTRVYYK